MRERPASRRARPEGTLSLWSPPCITTNSFRPPDSLPASSRPSANGNHAVAVAVHLSSYRHCSTALMKSAAGKR